MFDPNYFPVLHTNTNDGKPSPKQLTCRRTIADAIQKYVRGCGSKGATSIEIAQEMNLGRKTVAARLSELAKGGRLFRTSQTRRTGSRVHCYVYVCPEYRDQPLTAVAWRIATVDEREQWLVALKWAETICKRLNESKRLIELVFQSACRLKEELIVLVQDMEESAYSPSRNCNH